MEEAQKTKVRLEIAHVLFIDIVGYSKLTTEEESEALPELNRIVRNTEAAREADAARELIFLPTGDGIALVFTGSIEEPVECALQLSQMLRTKSNLPVRMGIHSGPVHHVADVNQRENIAGAGINIAQRVMDCGDAGHILVSKRVAEDLGHYRRWQPYLHDLGEFEVKHGDIVSVVNLYGDGAGNPAPPAKLKQSTRPGALSQGRSKRSPMLVGLLAVLLFTLAVIALVFAPAILKQLRNTDRGQLGVSSIPIAEKSIAVLPFENLSDDKGSAYFVAGMQDEILTALAKIRDLKVISRSSTAKYQSRPDNLKAIARELGVAAILEGSIQRLGDAVHVNVQLINTRDETHLWADSYDRQLKDVFGVEREIAETVAGKLNARLSPQDTKELSRVPTTNTKAYEAYLKATYVENEFRAGRLNSAEPAFDLYKEAVALDPHFALAYARLAGAELEKFQYESHSPQSIANAQTLLAKALELEPDLIEAHLLRAQIYLHVDHDVKGALAELESLVARAPNDARIARIMADAKGEMGDWQGQLTELRRAVELDPRNDRYLMFLGFAFGGLRRYAEAVEILTRVRALAPENWVSRMNLALSLVWSDRLAEARTEIEQWPDAKLPSLVLAAKYELLQQIETFSRNYDAALARAAKIPDIPNRLPTLFIPAGNIQKNTDLGLIHLYRGDKASAEQAFTAARSELEGLRTSNADNADFYRDESLILAGLGQHAEAVEAARKATSISKEDNYVFNLARIYAHFGDADLAFETMQKLIDKPTGGGELSAATLRRDPIWDPIRKDPRFEKAIASLAAKEVL
jgi:TolB-like protein/class 3 adenylate cyclase/Flp pilus assembly protein TadD